MPILFSSYNSIVNASLKVHHDVSAKVHQFKTYF